MKDYSIVQGASKCNWHPNSVALNGKAVDYARLKGSHFKYDTYIENELDKLRQIPNIINNHKLASQKLTELSQKIQRTIDVNSNKIINELF